MKILYADVSMNIRRKKRMLKDVAEFFVLVRQCLAGFRDGDE